MGGGPISSLSSSLSPSPQNSVDEFDPNEAPSNVQTTGSVDFG